MHLGYAVSFMARGSAPCETHSYRSFCKLEPTDYHKSHIRVAPTDPDNLPDYRLTTHSFTVGFQLGR